jgi:phosphoribosylformimino-5-aminoimidazole carboxamide ribotide isomerase
LKVIPVIDVKNGLVVWARMGIRETYRALKSWLCPNSSPVELVESLKKLGFKEVYVADLDAIEGKLLDFKLYENLASEVKLILDCGFKSLNDIEKALRIGVDKAVIATEAIPTISIAKEAIKTFGSERIVLSLDIKHGSVLSSIDELNCLKPLECLKLFWNIGFIEALVIDLDRVGSFSGLDFKLLKELKNGTSMKIIAGGGIKNLKEILIAKALGLEGVLIASALHKRLINLNDIKKLGLV